MPFQADTKVQQVAEAYALDAVDVARTNFRARLDFSDRSIESVEGMLSRLHDEMGRAQPSEEQVWQFAKTFGSYVGEVFRRNHGATWGMVTIEGKQFPGLKATKGTEFWPWGRVKNRLANGPEDNVWQYYLALLEGEGADSPPPAPERMNVPWWRRILGG